MNSSEILKQEFIDISKSQLFNLGCSIGLQEEEIKMDKYPHDSDSAFKSLKKGEKKFEIKPLPTDNIIEE